MLYERTTYTPRKGAFDAVLATRRDACEVRRGLGLPAGEIFVEATADGEDLVHWECRFATDEEHQGDMQARDGSADFGRVRAAMKDHVADFQRRVFRRAAPQGSVLRQLGPLENTPVVPSEVTFCSGGLTLAGYLYLPPGDGPFPCMVVNHGSSIHQGTTDVCKPGIAAVLMSWGLASFFPHRRGYGNSPGRPWREDVSADYGTEAYDAQLAKRLDEESNDVVAALEMLEDRPEVDAAHIGVMGSSFGGTVTLLGASKCDRFRCAVEFAGAAMNWERAPGLRKTMFSAAGKLTRPIYFVQAANDYSTAPTTELAAALEGTGKVFQSKIYPGFGLTKDEGHFLFKDGPAVWGKDVREFLDQWL